MVHLGLELVSSNRKGKGLMVASFGGGSGDHGVQNSKPKDRAYVAASYLAKDQDRDHIPKSMHGSYINVDARSVD